MTSSLCQNDVIFPTCRCFGLYIVTFLNKNFGMQFLLKSKILKIEYESNNCKSILSHLSVNITSFCDIAVFLPIYRFFKSLEYLYNQDQYLD